MNANRDATLLSRSKTVFSVISPSGIRALARSLGRDVRRVHQDVSALVDWGIVERTDDGKVEVPFDVIHADYDLRAVA